MRLRRKGGPDPTRDPAPPEPTAGPSPPPPRVAPNRSAPRGLWYLYGVNRALAASLIAVALGGAFALWLGSGVPARGPVPEQEALPPPTPPAPDVAAEPIPTTATLVIRLTAEDGSAVPAEAQAGYERFGVKRLRPPGSDGAYRFTDAPVGRLAVLAETPGRRTARATVTLVAGVPGEVILVVPVGEPGEAAPGGMAGGDGGGGGAVPDKGAGPAPEGPR